MDGLLSQSRVLNSSIFGAGGKKIISNVVSKNESVEGTEETSEIMVLYEFPPSVNFICIIPANTTSVYAQKTGYGLGGTASISLVGSQGTQNIAIESKLESSLASYVYLRGWCLYRQPDGLYTILNNIYRTYNDVYTMQTTQNLDLGTDLYIELGAGKLVEHTTASKTAFNGDIYYTY